MVVILLKNECVQLILYYVISRKDNGIMKLALLFLIIILSCQCDAADAYSLIDIVKEINKKSILIQKLSNETLNDEIRSFYDTYFLDGKNLFKYVGDDHSGVLKCGLFNLKKACYESIYKIDEIVLDNNTRCINLYGTHLMEPDLYIVQNTILFTKNDDTDDKWKVVGNRVGVSNLQLLVYGLLNNHPPEDSFTNRCFDKEKITKWKLQIVD